jgi:hypothetical protein
MARSKLTNVSPGPVTVPPPFSRILGSERSLIIGASAADVYAAFDGGAAAVAGLLLVEDTDPTSPADIAALPDQSKTGQVTVTAATFGSGLGANKYVPGPGVKAFMVRARVALLGTAGATLGQGGGFELMGSFSVNAAGVLQQEGTTTVVHSKADAGFNVATVPTFDATTLTTALDILCTNGAAGETNKWAVLLSISPISA